MSLQSDSEPCRTELSSTLSTSAVRTSRTEAPTPIAAIARSLPLPRIHLQDERPARRGFLRNTAFGPLTRAESYRSRSRIGGYRISGRRHRRTTASLLVPSRADRKSTRLNSSHLGISYA